MPFLSDFFASLFGPQAVNASAMSSSPDMAGLLGESDPGLRPGALAGGMGPGGGLYGGGLMSGRGQLSQEEQLSEYLRKLKEAQKREQMMKMLSMVQDMGQQPAPAGGISEVPLIGGGGPGVSRGGASNPGQQLTAMLGKAGGLGMPGAPMGYPGGVPGAAAGVGPSPAHMLQQLQMKRMANPYTRNLGRRFQY